MTFDLKEQKRNNFENNLFILKAFILSENTQIPQKIEDTFKDVEKFFNNSWSDGRFVKFKIFDICKELYSIPLDENQKSKMKLFFKIKNFNKIADGSYEIGLLLNEVLEHNEDHFNDVLDFFKENLSVSTLKYMSLHKLISKYPDKIKMFFKSDYDFEEDSTSWNYKIMFEALNNIPEQLKTLVDSGMSVKSKKGLLNKTLLHEAAIKKDIGKIDLLLQLGADINAVDKNENTPLYDSYILNRDTTFKYLLNNNAIVFKDTMLSLIEEKDNIVYQILNDYTFDKNSSTEISAAIEFWPELIPVLLTYKDINISSSCNIRGSLNNFSYTPIGRILEK